MLYKTQCTQVPPGASGSSTINAMLATPDGNPDQCKSGETSAPSQVYCGGIVSPSRNAELDISSLAI
jgi:hypothetical protein